MIVFVWGAAGEERSPRSVAPHRKARASSRAARRARDARQILARGRGPERLNNAGPGRDITKSFQRARQSQRGDGHSAQPLVRSGLCSRRARARALAISPSCPAGPAPEGGAGDPPRAESTRHPKPRAQASGRYVARALTLARSRARAGGEARPRPRPWARMKGSPRPPTRAWTLCASAS